MSPVGSIAGKVTPAGGFSGPVRLDKSPNDGRPASLSDNICRLLGGIAGLSGNQNGVFLPASCQYSWQAKSIQGDVQ